MEETLLSLMNVYCAFTSKVIQECDLFSHQVHCDYDFYVGSDKTNKSMSEKTVCLDNSADIAFYDYTNCCILYQFV